MSGKCSKTCIVSPVYELSLRTNVAGLELDSERAPITCTKCEAPATIVCVGCYCIVYCSKACLLADYKRHACECVLHSGRLWLFRNFELYSTQSVRIKHTGRKVMGLGMFARQSMAPGERIIEDYVHYTAEMIEHVMLSKDYSGFEELELYIKTIYDNVAGDVNETFAMHSGQMMAMTRGYQGFWTIFINHSCTPNAILRPSHCRTYILVTALRPIAAGEEITVSYSGVSYAPFKIRTPLLEQLLGCPCACSACKTVDSEEERQRFVVWDVIQHARRVYDSDLLGINKSMTTRVIIAIADRIIETSRKLLGQYYPHADPWLAIIEHTVCEFVSKACVVLKSRALRVHLKTLQQQSVLTSQFVGVCTRTNQY